MMNKFKLFLIVSLFVFNLSLAQGDMSVYSSYIKTADSLYAAKDYKNSAIAYESAINANDGKAYATDRYNAACTFALAGEKEKAFFHLFYSAEHPRIKYRDIKHISSDSDLDTLHESERWEELLNLVRANKAEIEKDYDRLLIAELDIIYKEDQLYRSQIKQIETKYGRDSNEMKAHWDLINKSDSLNLIKIEKILDTKGWLGPNVVGNQGNTTLFLVIQHSSLEVQEKYLPMMRDAVKKGNANGSSLALLEDRVALRKGEKQIYGSQIGRDQKTGEFYVMSLKDPENVDKRRAEVGLAPIQDYLNNWNLEWDVKKHIERFKNLD